MKKRVLIVLSEGFEDIEAVAVIDVLNRAGVDVTIAGLVKGPVKAAYGTTIMTDTDIDSVADDFDGIVFPGGGKNAENLAGHPRVIELVREFAKSGKLVGAICAAPSHVLSEAAGILKGRPATGDPVFNEKLAAGGAIVKDTLVNVDNNIITAMGPGAALQFGLRLAEYLVGKEIPAALIAKWRLSFN
jgi:4-methyl-5(b-hydroxyethyl)-thiazole monophosphate biosynthesis